MIGTLNKSGPGHCVVVAAVCALGTGVVWADPGSVVSGSGSRAAQADTSLTRTVTLDIPQQKVSTALLMLSSQANVQILMPGVIGDEQFTEGVHGKMPLEEALSRLLKGTTLQYRVSGENVIGIQAEKPAAGNWRDVGSEGLGGEEKGVRVAQESGNSDVGITPGNGPGASNAVSTGDLPDMHSSKGVPEILVYGKTSLNMDIERTRDDSQPYVVFDKEEIQRSQARDIESFLMTRLPMNTARQTIDQVADAPKQSFGGIDLRGLGTSQTLILVDGRRLPSSATGINNGDFLQPSLAGIPLSSIERIEILPATAGGIYGGGATGGVINIIRKRDYKGLELQLIYGSTFKSDAQSTDINLNGGFNVARFGTSITFGLSHTEKQPLLVNDRDFQRRSVELLFKNNPSFVFDQLVPPLGGTPNICAADVDFYEGFGYFGLCNGAPLTLDNGTTLGGASYTSTPKGYAGPASDGGLALTQNAGSYNFGATDTGDYLLRQPIQDSGFLGVRQEIGTKLSAYLDFTRFRTDANLATTANQPIFAALFGDDPGNPFQQDVTVVFGSPALRKPASSYTETTQAVSGLIARLPYSWSAALEYNWSRSKIRSQEASPGSSLITVAGYELLQSRPFSDPSTYPVDVSPYLLQVPNDFTGPFKTTLKATSLRLTGPAVRLPAGALVITGLAEYRSEYSADALEEVGNFLEPNAPPSSSVFTLYPHRNRNQRSYSLEAQMPLVASDQHVPAVRALSASLAIRHDAYETLTTSDQITAPTRDGPFAAATYFRNDVTSTDYTVALKYEPVADLTLRASYGTGFLPPPLNRLQPVEQVLVTPGAAYNLPDPLRSNTPLSVPRTEINGGNPHLVPEQSSSWAVGTIFQPRWFKGFRLSIDLINIEKTDETYTLDPVTLLAASELFPGRVVRGPNLPGDAPGWAGPVTLLDISAINLSSSQSRSVDIQADYAWDSTAAGTFRLGTVATRMLDLTRQLTPLTDSFDTVGYADGPLEWRATAFFTWQRAEWLVGWNTQFYDSYSIAFGVPDFVSQNPTRIANQGSESIPSQIYHDLFVQYRWPGAVGSWLGNTDISVGIQNVFNTSPPILAGFSLGSGAYSTYGDPRLRRFTLTLRKSFDM